ncbi:DUF3616 domain-containing protein [Chelatococcus sambhunathii]|uniref:DUF3616 domain-containing protein n=1 Tax=Chelatococcus sambhunathii TaxID=363953 RepID=A0ABU1DE03_9HYPH|nr:DUF3616 domain-containing protein [Chelatococcus sambhunathii]MDR4306346.1 DUF3616 domain-containing protein [Chelatococcus sambhunathii]
MLDRRPRRPGVRLAFALLAAAGAAPALAADKPWPLLKPSDGPLALSGSFGFDSKNPDPKEREKDIADLRRAASGVACGAPDRCLIAFDEGAEARLVTLTKDAYAPVGAPVVLGDLKEADAEAVAVDEPDQAGARRYYVAGSHAVSRKRCKPNKDARHVWRFGVAADGGVSGPAESADLWKLAKTTELAPFLDKCLGTRSPEKEPGKTGERGFDIEGMAWRGGRLYFGLRGPSQGVTTSVLSVDAKALFEGGDAAAKVLPVEVGEKRAIRDMQSVKDGVLLLVGPDDDTRDDDPQPWPTWRLLLWDGESPVAQPIGEFDLSGVKPRKLAGCKDKHAKLEAMAATDQPNGWRIVMLSDGLCDGGPLWFDVARP